MTLKVVLRMQAVEDEDAIFTYLQMQSPRTAARFQNAYQAALRAIVKNPLDGHRFPGEPEGLRYRRPVGFMSYFVIYREHSTAVEVLRILHGAMDFGAALGVTET
jgi:plasmid stabilization system protein ParE